MSSDASTPSPPSMPFRRLLVGLDFTETGDGLVDALMALRGWGVDTLILAHVCPESPVPLLHRGDHTRNVIGKLTEANAWLEPHFHVELSIRAGDPGPLLAEEAMARGADGVVLGVQAHPSWRDALLGDTVTQVARRCRLPLLLYPDTAVEHRRERSILAPSVTRILHPLDLEEAGSPALGVVRELARSNALPVTLLHVVEPGDAEVARSRAEDFLAHVASELEASGVARPAVEVASGEPWQVILEKAAQADPTLIVMGTRRRGALPRAVLGSQSLKVARHSRLPLLLVPTAA